MTSAVKVALNPNTTNQSISHNVFKSPLFQRGQKSKLCGKEENTLPLYQRQTVRLVQSESTCRPLIKCNSNADCIFDTVKMICEGDNAEYLLHFILIPQCFTKAYKVVKSHDCAVNG